MASKKVNIPKMQLEAYDRLIETLPEVERKGVTCPYTSINEHMFTFLSSTGELGLRLQKEERESFMKFNNTKLFESYGAVMGEYAAVPDDLLLNTEKIVPYLRKSYEYAKALKPKEKKKK